MSETTPLNEWPVDQLNVLKYMISTTTNPFSDKTKRERFNQNRESLLSLVNIAIKDAEEKLNELPFK